MRHEVIAKLVQAPNAVLVIPPIGMQLAQQVLDLDRRPFRALVGGRHIVLMIVYCICCIDLNTNLLDLFREESDGRLLPSFAL